MLPHRFHDWYVVRYEHRCASRQLVLDLDPPEGAPGGATRLIFEGVAAVELDAPGVQNILFEIVERPWDRTLELQNRIAQALDPGVVRLKHDQPASLDELLEILRGTPLKFFEIGTSYCLGGWIIAERASAAPLHAEM